jgi:glycosyltransferase involved in cell wall biosynthesis
LRITFCITNEITYDQRMHRISLALVDAGHQVTIVGRNKPNANNLIKQPFAQKRIDCFYTRGKLFYVEFNIRLFLWLLFQRTDLIGSIDLDTIVPVYLASLLRLKKRSFDAHELFPEVPELVGRPITKKIWLWIESVFMKRFPIRYTVSQSIADFYYNKYALPFHVIRNLPVSLPRFEKLMNNSSDLYILYQGALNDGRGLVEMIHAMKEIDTYTLKIAGVGDLSASLEALVQTLHLQEKVIFLGNVNPIELTTITSKAFMGINLLENKGLSYYYSLANKFFDYMHAAIPIITMNFPEYALINKDYKVAILLDDLSVPSIVAAVREVENKYEEMQNNCRRASSLFCWEKEAVQLLALY